MTTNLINPYNKDNSTGVINKFNSFLNFGSMPVSTTRGTAMAPGDTSTGNFAVSGQPGFDQKPITSTLMVAPVKGDVQMKFKEGDLIWNTGTKQDISKQRYITDAIWSLNYNLENAYRLDQERKKEALGKSKKNLRPTIPILYPLTIEQFNDMVFFNGVQMTDANATSQVDTVHGASRMRMFAIDNKGRGRVGNIWGGNVQQGDNVGFLIKEVSSPYNGFYDIDGVKIAPTTEGKFLQVLPVWFKNGKGRKYSSVAQEPQDQDIFYMSNRNVTQRIYANSNSEEGGLFDHNQELTETVSMNYQDITEGRQFKVGKILHIGPTPSIQDMKMGLRSHIIYKKLWSEFYLELEVDPLGDFPYISQ
jgi:hypothetical protein